MQTGKYLITQKQNLAKNMYGFVINCPQLADEAQAGQFVQVRAEGFFLRRPISICEINGENIRIVFEIRGGGTNAMASLNEGDAIDIIGPLGNGFKIDKNKKAVVVGGGIGVPPLLQVAKMHNECKAVLGFRTAKVEILSEDFKSCGADVTVCTDDGTMGFHGFVTQALKGYLQNNTPDVIYTCGPRAMLNGIIEIAQNRGIACQVSLEERMACGVGACLVCQCKLVRDGKDYSGHVCKDGPVFPAEEVFL